MGSRPKMPSEPKSLQRLDSDHLSCHLWALSASWCSQRATSESLWRCRGVQPQFTRRKRLVWRSIHPWDVGCAQLKSADCYCHCHLDGFEPGSEATRLTVCWPNHRRCQSLRPWCPKWIAHFCQQTSTLLSFLLSQVKLSLNGTTYHSYPGLTLTLCSTQTRTLDSCLHPLLRFYSWSQCLSLMSPNAPPPFPWHIQAGLKAY